MFWFGLHDSTDAYSPHEAVPARASSGMHASAMTTPTMNLLEAQALPGRCPIAFTEISPATAPAEAVVRSVVRLELDGIATTDALRLDAEKGERFRSCPHTLLSAPATER